MITYILDGHNILHLHPALRNVLQKDHAGAKEKLLAMLSGFAQSGRKKIIVVFDGVSDGEIGSGNSLSVLYADRGKNADMKIKDLINRSGNPKLLCVVSNDNEVINYAKINSCSTLTTNEFFEQLGKGRNISNEEKPSGVISEGEMKEWMDLFSNRNSK